MNQVERSRLARLITWLIVGVVVLILVRLLFALLRVSVGIVGWLLFTVLPLILLGWLAMKLWDRHRRGRASRP
ncbi:MAG TPA: hypothetical protein VMN78_09235 [Longimicrobiales bacterium]|nr:hypothetical protein [Longimicrobiales bacterium]